MSSPSSGCVPPRGALIVLEGLDRSGKSSQCLNLFHRLSAEGVPCSHARFPDRTTTIGQMIDRYLKLSAEMDDHCIHLLFAANRWESRAGILSDLQAGKTVLVDRYGYSGVAFSAAKGLDFSWCLAAERGLPAPDLVLFLDISSEAAQARGGYGEERYEKKEIQERVKQQFNTLRQQAADESFQGVGAHVKWQVINADNDRDTILQQLHAAVTQTIEQVKFTQIKTL